MTYERFLKIITEIEKQDKLVSALYDLKVDFNYCYENFFFKTDYSKVFIFWDGFPRHFCFNSIHAALILRVAVPIKSQVSRHHQGRDP